MTAATAVPFAALVPVGCDSAVNRSAHGAHRSLCHCPRCSAMGCLVHAAACGSYFMPQRHRLASQMGIPPPPSRRGLLRRTHISVHLGQPLSPHAARLRQANGRKPSHGRRSRLLGLQGPTGLIAKIMLPPSSPRSLPSSVVGEQHRQPLAGKRQAMGPRPIENRGLSQNDDLRPRAPAVRRQAGPSIKRCEQNHRIK